MMPDTPQTGNRLIRRGCDRCCAASPAASRRRQPVGRSGRAARAAPNRRAPTGSTSAPSPPTSFTGSGSGPRARRSSGRPPSASCPTRWKGRTASSISPDGKYLYMTTGHGRPDGKLWKYELGRTPTSSSAKGSRSATFPASVDVTPDGLYSLSVNFNLHGDMVPSTVSVVYTPDRTEVARIVTCTMPHGSRIDPSGTRQYSTCMMDDQLVEIDTVKFEVSRRFSVAKGKEGPIAAAAPIAHAGHAMPDGGCRRNRRSIPRKSATRRAPRDDAGDLLAHLGAAVGRRQEDLRRVQQGRRDRRNRSRRRGRSRAACRPAAASTTSP